MSILFTILFKKNNGETFSATFDEPIELTCKLKYIDLDGIIYDLRNWDRTLNYNSTKYHIIHDATEKQYPLDCDSFCCNISRCTQFLNNSNMGYLSNCCNTDRFYPKDCNICLTQTAIFNSKYNIKLLNILSTSGDSTMSLENYITLFKNNNSLITDGNSATLISLDSSSNIYSSTSSISSISDSKQYKLETNDQDCDSFCCNPISTCKQLFKHSSIGDLSFCCNNTYPNKHSCRTCLTQTAVHGGIYVAINKQHIGTYISIKKPTSKYDISNTILKKDTNLVITDGTSAALISLSKH